MFKKMDANLSLQYIPDQRGLVSDCWHSHLWGKHQTRRATKNNCKHWRLLRKTSIDTYSSLKWTAIQRSLVLSASGSRTCSSSQTKKTRVHSGVAHVRCPPSIFNSKEKSSIQYRLFYRIHQIIIIQHVVDTTGMKQKDSWWNQPLPSCSVSLCVCVCCHKCVCAVRRVEQKLSRFKQKQKTTTVFISPDSRQ